MLYYRMHQFLWKETSFLGEFPFLLGLGLKDVQLKTKISSINPQSNYIIRHKLYIHIKQNRETICDFPQTDVFWSFAADDFWEQCDNSKNYTKRKFLFSSKCIQLHSICLLLFRKFRLLLLYVWNVKKLIDNLNCLSMFDSTTV